MKIMPPVIRYKCEFCNRKAYVSKSACLFHENRCFRNPNRSCTTCGNTGTEFFDALGANLGVIPDAESRDCVSCRVAEELGGKSYISI